MNCYYLISCNFHEMAAQNICPIPFFIIYLFVKRVMVLTAPAEFTSVMLSDLETM